MTTKYVSVQEFQKMVRELIQESVHEEMVKELGLNEAAGGTLSSTPSIATVGTSSSTGTSGTKSGVGTTPGNDDPANNVMVPGTNMNVNQGLQAAAKETNFKKKAELAAKITAQIDGMKGVVMKENASDTASILQRVIELNDEVESIKQAVSGLADSTPKTAVHGGRYLKSKFEDMRMQLNKGAFDSAAREAKSILHDPANLKPTTVFKFRESIDEPDVTPGAGVGPKVNTRAPMFPELINRITNLVYYGEKSDEEILADLGPEATSNPKMIRWIKFIADMVRKGKEIM